MVKPIFYYKTHILFSNFHLMPQCCFFSVSKSSHIFPFSSFISFFLLGLVFYIQRFCKCVCCPSFYQRQESERPLTCQVPRQFFDLFFEAPWVTFNAWAHEALTWGICQGWFNKTDDRLCLNIPLAPCAKISLLCPLLSFQEISTTLLPGEET